MKLLFLVVILLNVAFFGWHSVSGGQQKEMVESIYAPPVSEKIRLLSEESTASQNDNRASIVASNETLEVALNKAIDNVVNDKANFLCPRIEIERKSDKAEVINALLAIKWNYQEKASTGSRARFWLYISAPKSPEAAKQIVSSLSAKSIDSFVINRGEMKNRISLGLFSSKERAVIAGEQIQKKSGYSVNIYDHMRNVPLEIIDIDQPVTEKDWSLFVSRLDLGAMAIKLEKNPC